MSKSVEEMLKELSDFAEKASAAAKADALIKTAPADAMRQAFCAVCNVTVGLAKGKLKPENIPDSAPELALVIMGVVAEKKTGIGPEEPFGEKKPAEDTRRDVHVVSGTLEELMSKIGELLKDK